MKRILSILMIFVAGKLLAQQDFILYHMPSIPQITRFINGMAHLGIKLEVIYLEKLAEIILDGQYH